MKFENQYLSYTEYRLLGGKIELMPFNLLEFEARKIIDRRTQGRLIKVKCVPQEVKMCISKMINTISSYISATSVDTANGIKGNVSSESTDGYSVSYITVDQIQEKAQSLIKSKNSELEDIMMNYLINTVIDGTPILYLGVR